MLIKQHNHLFNLPIPKKFKIVYVWGKKLALFANKQFKKEVVIIYLKGMIVDAADSTPEAVQVADKKFIDTKYLVVEDFINHSCDPNTRLDIEKRQFIAIKDIHKNEEITFNYLTTEWDMKKWGDDFQCLCGSKNCFGHIKGFTYLTRAQKTVLKPLLSPFLLKQIEK